MDQVEYKSLPKVSNTLRMVKRRAAEEARDPRADNEAARAASEKEGEELAASGAEPIEAVRSGGERGSGKTLSMEEMLERARRSRAGK